MDYKKFLIQQQTYDGVNYTDVGNVKDSYVEWKVVCKDIPFMFFPETKELATRDWYDEHGEEVFIPSDGVMFKAYDLDIEFLYVGDKTEITQDLKGFIKFITGRNSNGSPMLKFYDEYIDDGRQGIYVKSVDEKLFLYDDSDTEAIASFTVKFRVTDPVTEMTVSASGENISIVERS